ncbi:hypothetical protein AB7315_08645 [Providencia manganoxydans]|uniref:hypothetical protein n=1 Tax=Providencia manganoxydans TaxID=2923283 RepID=UPI0032DB12AB
MVVTGSKGNVSLIQLFIIYNIIILPIFDNISGALFKLNVITDGGIGSPSQLGRFIAIFFIVFLIFKVCQSNTRKISLFILTYFIITELVISLFHNELMALLYGFVTSLKVAYALLCVLLFTDLVKQNRLNSAMISNYIIIYGTVVSIFVLLSYFSGFHISNYSKGVATRGLFISGNGLGVVIGISSLILIYNTAKFTTLKLLHILLLLLTVALIGTKAALFFLILGISFFLFKTFKKRPFFSVLVLFSTIYFSFSVLLQNLEMIFENIIFKFENIDDKLLLLASSRDSFILDAFDIVNWNDIYALRFIFGAGAYYAYLDPTTSITTLRKLLENDLFELFFSYGFVLTLLYISLYLIAVGEVLKKTKNYFYLFIFSLVYLHSITVGHVLFNGTSSLMLGLTFSLIFCRKNPIQQ